MTATKCALTHRQTLRCLRRQVVCSCLVLSQLLLIASFVDSCSTWLEVGKNKYRYDPFPSLPTFPFPFTFYPPAPFLFLPLSFPSLPCSHLRSRFLKSNQGVWGSGISSPSGVQGRKCIWSYFAPRKRTWTQQFQ